MKIAYLILAHAFPSHLAKLVTALDGEDHPFFHIHIDAKSGAFLDSPSLDPIKRKGYVNFLTDRVPVYWGGYSMVEATLRLLRHAVETSRFDYAVLLSGQDFPIKANAYISSFFEENSGKEFLSYTTIPSQEWDWGPEILQRIECYWWVDYVRCLLEATGSRILQRWGWSVYYALTTSFFQLAPTLKRKFLQGTAPFGGPNWFAISFGCAKHVLDYVQHNPEFSRFFANALNPDELFLQTLIMNSPFREYVVNDALRYTDWEAGKSSPRVLTSDDFDRIIRSEALFARKFEEPQSTRLVERLIEHVEMDRGGIRQQDHFGGVA